MKKLFALICVCSTLYSCGIVDKGEKIVFGLGEIYYKDGISAKEAENFGTYLYRKDIFNIEGKKVIQLVRKNDTLTMRLVTNENYIKDPSYIQSTRLFAAELSSAVFSDAPLNAELMTPYFNTETTIKAFGRKVLTRDGNYYYSYSIGENKGASLFMYLKDSLSFFTNFEGSLLVNETPEQFEIEIVTPESIEESPATLYTYKLVALSVAKKYFGSIKSPVSLKVYNLSHKLQKEQVFKDGKWE